MEKKKVVRLVSQDSMEQAFRAELSPTPSASTASGFAIASASGFAIASASGFAIASASGFAIASASGFAIA